jgi:hypothetical protein
MPKDTIALKENALLGICNIPVCHEQLNIHVYYIILYELTYLQE